MKKLLVFILLMVSIVSYGQNEIILQKGIRIYCINKPTINLQVKQYVTYGAITETVNKNKKWYIVKFINVGEKLEKYYNAIIISKTQNIKNKVYVVMYDDLGYYKYLIDDVNNKIKEKYDSNNDKIRLLKDSLILVEKTYMEDTLSNNIKYKNRSLEFITYYEKRKKQLIDSVIFSQQKQKEKIYNELSQKLKTFTKHINITRSELYYPNSAGGCDVCFHYINTSNKKIKYLYFRNNFYNRVDDKVSCEIYGFNFKKCEDVGMIDPGESGGGTWENVIYNYSANYLTITSINIIYSDGTVYNISLTKNEYTKLIRYFDFINRINDNIEKSFNNSGLDAYLKDNLEKLKTINEDQNTDAYIDYDTYKSRLNSKILILKDSNNILYEFNIKSSMLYINKPNDNKQKYHNFRRKNIYSVNKMIYEINRLNKEFVRLNKK
jgi:hypothetical protein